MVTKSIHGHVPNPTEPKYQRLKRHLLHGLVNGKYRPDEALPSENVLVRQTGYARNTVRQALSELERDGLIRRVRGKGTFVTSQRERKALEQLGAFAIMVPVVRGGTYPVLANGLEQVAHDTHHRLIVCNTHNDVDRQASIILQLLDKNVGGVLLAPTTATPTPAHHVRLLQTNGIPVVLNPRAVAGAAAPLLTWRAEDVCQVVAKVLVERGHRDIGYAAIYRYSLTEAYERSLRSALGEWGLALREDRVFYGPQPDKDGIAGEKEEHLQAVLAQERRATALFCSGYEEAERVFVKALQMGIKVPQDLSIVAFGEENPQGALAEQLAAVTVDEYGMGLRAGEVLCEMREGKRPIDNDEKIVFPVDFREGQTLAPAAR